ncbi:MAG: hypothetical protein ABSG33_12365 [Candidatus Bathyarchaeia archaeon]
MIASSATLFGAVANAFITGNEKQLEDLHVPIAYAALAHERFGNKQK